MNDQPDNRMMEEWFKLFDDIHFGPINANNSNISDNFKKNFEDFWDKINPSLLSSTVSTESTSERPTKLIK
ncbi:hypothetical protein C1645_802240 [Glomus cerebriforme]|uniref:Uncharacterized protein n=1 Tax=Glomus cerebriforme TaxID=658196 RepID=A0A397TEM8_9GLOM|nr:hypothetical protein C1645_802240 [Glomus cerebriforme]